MAGVFSGGGAMRVCHVPALVASLLAVLLAVVSTTAHSHADCPGVYEYRLNGNYYVPNSQWAFDLQSRCDEAASAYRASANGQTYDISVTAQVSPNHQVAQCNYQLTKKSDGSKTNGVWAAFVRVAQTCPPPPPECDQSQAGQYRDTKPMNFTDMPKSGTLCDGASGCKSQVSDRTCIGGVCIFEMQIQSEACEIGDSAAEPPILPADRCVSSSELELCQPEAKPPGRNCGYVNGDFVCVDAVKPGECKILASGGSICGASAGTPPAPDSGTRGQAATPDEQVAIDDGDTVYNYYNSTTVAGSSNPQGDGSDPYAEPPAGSETGGTGTGDGLHCDPSSDSGCSAEGDGGGPPGDPRDGWQCWAEGDGFKAAAQACVDQAATALWNGLMNNSSLVATANAVVSAWPSGGGSCPSAPVVLLDHTFDFWEVPCSFLDDVAAVLGPLFLLFWSVMGLRILLTIPGAD